ncbi:MAG: Asp-tRNA(Asn)/Glu-tRNA(Gln) amidotransferase subunit GatA [Candidatus Eisenbacteria bacterium]|uniref:Glutamyl-tRNA(Gln) amidotransferase subunit A n=1 Tax=Eiseniibacteriota bacterium TaxID=2212470 RepID=A0A948RT53_UNCEI|nr:Asp-tRNA(Asn)/Glu-tRNA(Gln) amidotransferase subunit GatA [Candidatus Eisenbacteria bacterium]MBU1947754.1 Asp-tRNA(Asn)/Glu-tRNA(Gln) amidotransferase subunit GatA [Candidatus Eisenbacteria bacterium]MBU2690543.1 Asp-tRNA(Asn)/Glu-tRNA(Gln) amidotransferase subunit GatA [Candidatus Eisenbacteria bacterium]
MTLWRMGAVEAAGLIRRGELRAAELVGACLSRLKDKEKEIHAFLKVDEAGSLTQAAAIDNLVREGSDPGPLAGIPVAVKDNICTKDLRTTCASRILKDFDPIYDATAIQKLRRAGAVILGKTNLDEFGMGSSTENSAFGPTRNPWDETRVPGGSSGGSAAALCAGMAPLALGTDTGGSVRQPAAFCGVTAFKPSYGAVSRYGLVAFASGFDTMGSMARGVADCLQLYNVICGPDSMDSTSAPDSTPINLNSLRGPVADLVLGLPRRWIEEGCNREVFDIYENTVRVLKESGVRFQEIDMPKPDHAVSCYYILTDAEASSNLARYDGVRFGYRAADGEALESLESLYKHTRGKGFGPEVKRRVILGSYLLSAGYCDAYYLRAQKIRGWVKESLTRAFERVSALLLPTSPTPAFKLGERIKQPLQMYLSDLFTVSANLSGAPALAFPAGFTQNNLPVGLQLMGRPGEEEHWIRPAHLLEQTLQLAQIAPDKPALGD